MVAAAALWFSPTMRTTGSSRFHEIAYIARSNTSWKRGGSYLLLEKHSQERSVEPQIPLTHHDRPSAGRGLLRRGERPGRRGRLSCPGDPPNRVPACNERSR